MTSEMTRTGQQVIEFEEMGPPPTKKSRAEIQKRYRETRKGKEARQRAVARYEQTAKGKEARKRAKKAQDHREWLARPFVAWDGEGVTRKDGRHDYVLLAFRHADGTTKRITSLTHLSTKRIFEFALENSDNDAINVIYGASYDWNMFLSDLNEEELRELYDEGRLWWEGYLIKWRRGKTLEIYSRKRSIRFYDVISFFQTSFVNACASYLGDDFPHRELIETNKRLRSSFRSDDLSEISRYNDAELENLLSLMQELRERLARANLKPSRWDGPGAIAVALMQRQGVKEHKGTSPDIVGKSVRSAYFGGRFEVRRFGHVEAPAYEYDINSAYPRALLEVPSLAGGTWHFHKGDPGSHPFALYNLHYDGTGPGMRMDLPQPLPVRHRDGSVAFPLQAIGTYWTPEVDVTRRYVEQYGGKLTIHSAWIFEPASTVRPFEYLGPLYALRQKLKASGDGAHVAYKLAMNSHYGKLAQQVGWWIDDDGNIHIPPYHQLEWAGYVTSYCRAMVYGAALPALERIIAWETDAVFTDVPLDVPIGTGLGEWSAVEFRDLTYLQSGMYFATTVDGKEIAKTRGVDKGSVTREMVLDALRRGEDHLPAQLTRFTGAGIALQSRFEHWRRWETVPKNIALFPDGKTFHASCNSCDSNGFRLGVWHTTLVTPRAGVVSREYPVGWINPNPAMAELEELRNAHYESEIFED